MAKDSPGHRSHALPLQRRVTSLCAQVQRFLPQQGEALEHALIKDGLKSGIVRCARPEAHFHKVCQALSLIVATVLALAVPLMEL